MGYYQRQERQFVRAYTRHLPNLSVEFTLMVESSYAPIKSVTNRHTPISDFLQQICMHIEIMQNELQKETNRQKIQLPKLMDRRLFQTITPFVTHETINLLSFELDLSKKWVEDVGQNTHQHEPPIDEGCVLDCELPI